MTTFSLTPVLFLLLILLSWIISEIILVQSIKNSKNDDSIWLVINIFLPIFGCVIYKLTHKTQKEQ